jgi:hypothetical protein
VLGQSDTLWPDGISCFGAEIPEQPEPSVNLTETYAFRAAMREWIYGNSKSLGEGWGAVLRSEVARSPVAIDHSFFQSLPSAPTRY